MMHVRFLSLILGLLLVMPGIRDYSSAHAHQDEKTARNGLAAGNQEYIVSAREEIVHAVASINTRKLRLEGRKMAADKASGEEFVKDQERKNEGTSEISGKSGEASKRSLVRIHYQVDDQKNIERKTLKSGSSGIPMSQPAGGPRANSNPRQSEDSKTLRTKASLKGSPRSDNKVSQEVDDTDEQTVETQRLLVATKEIVNLLNKDYRGMARRKPPINNQEPRH